MVNNASEGCQSRWWIQIGGVWKKRLTPTLLPLSNWFVTEAGRHLLYLPMLQPPH